MNFLKNNYIFSLVGFFILFYPPSPSFAKSAIIHSGENWVGSVVNSKNNRICFVHGKPKKSSGKYSRRGPTYLQVTFRPKEKIRDEVSVTAGYPYKKDTEVTVEIDGQKKVLFTSEDSAWSYSARDDIALVKEMRGGRELVIKGISKLGTLTTDRYSLIGFTAAYNAVREACKSRK
ncbi:MAG: invasion associated locus B family protein [Rhodospirillaceae bacterium]|jgi:hypothetical protein